MARIKMALSIVYDQGHTVATSAELEDDGLRDADGWESLFATLVTANLMALRDAIEQNALTPASKPDMGQ